MKQGWEIKKLGEVCAKLTDGSHNPPKGVIHSNFIMLSSQNVFNDCLLYDDVRFLQEEDFIREDKRTYVREGDVLLTIVGTIGRCAVFTGNKRVALQRSVAVLHPHINILPRFLMYCLIGRNTSLNEQAHGIAQKGIYLKQLSQINIPVPPLPEQEKIVAELDCLSGIIEKKRQQLKELDALAQSIFYEMFGDSNEFVPLSFYVESLSAGKSLASDEECSNKVLKTGAVTYDYFDGKQVKNLPLEYIPQESHKVKVGDVLISRMNTAELVGACAYVWNVGESIYLPDRLWRVEIKESFNPIFLWKAITTNKSKEQIRNYASGTSGSMKNISKSSLLKVQIPKTTLFEQQTFASKIESIEKQKELIKQSLGEVETLFNARMQEYFG